MVKLWVVLFMSGQAVMNVGPLPKGVTEAQCKGRALYLQEQARAGVIRNSLPHDPKSVQAVCLASAERPKMGVAR